MDIREELIKEVRSTIGDSILSASRDVYADICKKNNITLDSYEKSLLNGITFKIIFTEGSINTNVNLNTMYRDILHSWPNIGISAFFDHHLIFFPNEMKQPEMKKPTYILEVFKLTIMCIGFCIIVYTWMQMEN